MHVIILVQTVQSPVKVEQMMLNPGPSHGQSQSSAISPEVAKLILDAHIQICTLFATTVGSSNRVGSIMDSSDGSEQNSSTTNNSHN